MELIGLGIVLAVGLLAWYGYSREQARLASEREQALARQLSASLAAAEEDVTVFGEELQRLDADVAGHPLDDAMRQDYQQALDAYDNAKESLAAVRQPDEVRHVTEILEQGRYAVACVRARASGEPLPVKRPPCFFNPAHGPSTRNVDWAPAGGTVRSVPACAADAERVLAGAEPWIRTVPVGAERVPYWQAGESYAPWAQGYYRSWGDSALVRDIAVGTLIATGAAALPQLLSGLAGPGAGRGRPAPPALRAPWLSGPLGGPGRMGGPGPMGRPTHGRRRPPHGYR